MFFPPDVCDMSCAESERIWYLQFRMFGLASRLLLKLYMLFVPRGLAARHLVLASLRGVLVLV